MRFLTICGTIALVSGAVFGAEPKLIVDTAFVEQAALRGAIVWDARDEESYAKGHLPGAVNIGAAADVLRDPNSEDYVPLARLQKLLGDAGIDPTKEVIAYAGRGGTASYFAQLTMQYLQGRRAHVYHGGIDDWVAAGKPLSTTPTRLAAIKVTATPAVGLTVDTDEVLARLGKAEVQIVDARTRDEFAGQDIRALRGGHIPGAVNIPYEENWLDPETPKKLARREVRDSAGMGLKPSEQLARLYGGLDKSKETIVYCQSGVRAAETAAVLKDLGFNKVKVYDASWLGYGNRFDAPAEAMTYFNVGQLKGQLGAMQRRIDALERELEAAKKAR